MIHRVINREESKTRKGLYACFIDLRMAFNWIGRSRLEERLGCKGAKEFEAKSNGNLPGDDDMMKTGKGKMPEFETTKGVR